MIWYLTGFLWIIQIYLWGIGLALWVIPRRWRRFWPAFAPMLGLALQSLVVWLATHTALPGTDSYAVASLIIPIGLLLAALRRIGIERAGWLLLEIRKWWAVAAIMALSLVGQLLPFTKPPARLTSIAIGSCDAADYAAGARVFKEFSSRDRSGFLGNTEVVHLLDVDNFFDFWLKINHFTPSALIALNASLFGLQPYELTSLLGAVLLALNLPVVYWLARSGFRFHPYASLGVTAIYGFSPILWYAVYQTALGQLLAAPAVALLTWTGIRAFRVLPDWKNYAAYFGLLLACNWLIFGSYNFFILFAYIPSVACVGLSTLCERCWARAVRWIVFVGVNLLVCAMLFPGRVMTLAQRFLLFSITPFGWRMPRFRPDGWYGSFADGLLHPVNSFWSLALGAACLLTLAWAVAWSWRRRPRMCALALASTLPIFCGYAMLLWKEDTGNNSSYDAYKLFSVFYPSLLAGLCLWMQSAWQGRGAQRAWTLALSMIVVLVNGWGAWRFNDLVRRTAVTVDPFLVQIAEAERLPNVASVNVCLSAYWPRMWANYFLLHKPQYFPLPTYEGRRITPLRGQWDLLNALILVRPPNACDLVEFNSSYYLLNRQSEDHLEAQFGEGWYAPERNRQQNWCWSKGAADLILKSEEPAPLRGTIRFSARSLSKRRLMVWDGANCLWEGTVGVSPTQAADIRLTVPTGTTRLRFETPEPADHLPGDERALTFALTEFEIDLQKTSPEAPKEAAVVPTEKSSG